MFDFTLVISLAREAILMVISLALPLLAVGMISGIIVSVIQTVTSVQEQSISYVVKFIAIFITLIYLSNWMMHLLVNYTIRLIDKIPQFIS